MKLTFAKNLTEEDLERILNEAFTKVFQRAHWPRTKVK